MPSSLPPPTCSSLHRYNTNVNHPDYNESWFDKRMVGFEDCCMGENEIRMIPPNPFPPLMFLTPRPRETQEHQSGGRKITVLNIDVELPGS